MRNVKEEGAITKAKQQMLSCDFRSLDAREANCNSATAKGSGGRPVPVKILMDKLTMLV